MRHHHAGLLEAFADCRFVLAARFLGLALAVLFGFAALLFDVVVLFFDVAMGVTGHSYCGRLLCH